MGLRMRFLGLWAHPRVCGENSKLRRAKNGDVGSSPRVRGKLELFHEGGCENGLIPACAGKTLVVVHGMPRSWAHPRVCGENLGEFVGGAAFEGSSPRVRGKPDERCDVWTATRLIPACAGKT